MVGDLNLFNNNCGSATVYFDGASVNNEHFTSIKECNAGHDAAQQTFLDNLASTAANASPLPLHFSISWNWWCCDCSQGGSERIVNWQGVSKNALEHMVDIADSVDVQVAWNVGNTMAHRSLSPYLYWDKTKRGTTSTTGFYVLAYTNPNSDCRLSFAPHTKGAATDTDTCTTGDRSERGMFEAFDEVTVGLPHAQGGIHFIGGAFSTGMPGWPTHSSSGTVTTSAPTSSPTASPVMVDCSRHTRRRRCNRDTSCHWVGNRRRGSCNVI